MQQLHSAALPIAELVDAEAFDFLPGAFDLRDPLGVWLCERFCIDPVLIRSSERGGKLPNSVGRAGVRATACRLTWREAGNGGVAARNEAVAAVEGAVVLLQYAVAPGKRGAMPLIGAAAAVGITSAVDEGH